LKHIHIAFIKNLRVNLSSKCVDHMTISHAIAGH